MNASAPILAIQTAIPTGSTAIVTGGRLMAERNAVEPNHGSVVAGQIAELLSSCGLKAGDLGGIAVAIGPGSFTGLRIGLATAKGLAYAEDLPIAPLSTLKALAYAVPGYSGLLCPCLDARKEEVFGAAYRSDKQGRLTVVIEEQAIKPAILAALLAEQGESVCFLGDGAGRYQELFIGSLEGKAFLPGLGFDIPRAVHLAAMAQCGGEGSWLRGAELAALAPCYLRAAEAERKKTPL